MRLDAVVRRQSTRITIMDGPQPALAQAVLAALSNALHICEKRLTSGVGPYAVPPTERRSGRVGLVLAALIVRAV